MLSVIILAAGQGTRMFSHTPKILHQVVGKPIVHHVLDAALALDPQEVITVISPHVCASSVVGERAVKVAIQEHPRGTGDAVRSGLGHLSNSQGDVLIVCGDTPLIQVDELVHLLAEHRLHPENSISVLGMRLNDPRQYGRIVADGKNLNCIVEYKDATDVERQINLCNTGIIITSIATLKNLLPKLTCNNSAQEYYLTDIIELANKQSINRYVVESKNPDLFHGVNNRVELAIAERQYQAILRDKIMRSGVTLLDPDTIYFNHDTIIGKDTTIYPNVFFGEEVVVGEGATIYPSCYLVKTRLGNQTKIGPFAHLREYTILEDNAEIGNFVEVKKSTLGKAAKAKHLTYLGDAIIGAKANIGAGVITCNYDGISKHQTIIGERAFIGSNSSLIAPVSIGEDAIVGAGSAITNDVPAQALGIARGKQEVKLNWTKSFHQNYEKIKG
jgi:bifunctional UDP-N-acetylglucosamine pyrophosphorylase/glucosamine-1-phosphate N-acetyltransferase